VLRRRTFAYQGGPNFAVQVDRGDIAWGLIRPSTDPVSGVVGVQGNPGGNLGIARGVGQQVGATSSLSFGRKDNAGDGIDRLAGMDAGFDWDVTAYGPSDLRLDCWAPSRGSNNGVVLAWGGGLVTGIAQNIDVSGYGNSIYLTGQGSLVATHSLPSHGALDASDIASRPEGRWDQTVGTNLGTQDAVDKSANWYLRNAQTILPSYTVVMAQGAWQGPQHIWLGDTVVLWVKDGSLQIEEALPVSEMQFDINDSNTETVTLTVGAPAPRFRRRIPLIERRLSALETQVNT